MSTCAAAQTHPKQKAHDQTQKRQARRYVADPLVALVAVGAVRRTQSMRTAFLPKYGHRCGSSHLLQLLCFSLLCQRLR